MLVVFAGLPGTGKSTIARQLADETGAVWLRVESIEQALRDSGVVTGPLNDAGYRAGVRVVEIEIVCSDEKEHRRRVETRSSDITGLRLPDGPEVIVCEYHPWDRDHVVIDAAKQTIAESVSNARAALTG